jgi:hypothetical protein
MRKMFVTVFFLLLPALLPAQEAKTPSSFQPATITQVRLQKGADTSDPVQALYEVSVNVNGATYVVLTTSPFGETNILHIVGRELLVCVGDKTITWNDILGHSHEVPIISSSPAPESQSQK